MAGPWKNGANSGPEPRESSRTAALIQPEHTGKQFYLPGPLHRRSLKLSSRLAASERAQKKLETSGVREGRWERVNRSCCSWEIFTGLRNSHGRERGRKGTENYESRQAYDELYRGILRPSEYCYLFCRKLLLVAVSCNNLNWCEINFTCEWNLIAECYKVLTSLCIRHYCFMVFVCLRLVTALDKSFDCDYKYKEQQGLKKFRSILEVTYNWQLLSD